MKQRNRILSLMLAILLVVGMLPISTMTALAAPDDTYTLTLVYEHELTNGATAGIGIEDVIVKNIPHGTVIDLSDYWPDEMTVIGDDENTYYFGDFLTKLTGGAVYPQYEITSDTTLYASWVTTPQITLSFDGNGGSVVYKKERWKHTNSLISYVNIDHIPERQGFKFLGWSYSRNSMVGDSDEPIVQDCTLYAHWEELHFHCVCGGNTNIGDHTSHSDIEFTPWNKADAMPTEAGNYVLMNDVTISETWVPASSAPTTICLNGRTLSYSGSSKDRVILLRGDTGRTLNICDCSNGSGKITGATSSGIGVAQMTVLNMYGGIITGNNGGILIGTNGHFNMYGGEISDNTLTSYSSGAGVQNNGTFIMMGGSITDNRIAEANYHGGGVYSASDAIIEISGNAVIKNNINIDKPSNLHLASNGTTDAKITVGELGSNASIGVSVDSNHGMIISDGGKDYAYKFFSDNGAYAVAVEGDNLKLVEAYVQVGQVTLKNGEYTTNGTSKTAGEPTGTGYAYFKNGVLTLNNFTYTGGSVHSNPAIGSDLAAIFCEHDLTIKVEGINNITRVVTDSDTETQKTLRGIWNNGDLKIVGDGKNDIFKVTVSGHNGAMANAVESIDERIFIDNCTLEAKSVTGGYALIGYKAVTITKSKVVASTGTADDSRSTFGIYTMSLKVTDSDVIGIAEDNASGVASGIHIAGNNAKLIFESGSIIGRTSDVSDDSYAVYVDSGDVTLPAKYWMRTSASSDFAEGTWDGANIGPYVELTTSKLQNEWVSTPTIRGWIYNTVKSTPQAEAKYGTVEFKYYDADKNLLTELPANAGKYYLKGFVAETDDYTGLESDYVWFAVEKDEQYPPRPTGVNTTYIDTNDGKITGVDSTMEYRKEGETAYTAVTGTEITGLAPGKYYVRYAEKANYNPSPDNVITIELGGKRTPTIDTNPTASRVIIGGKLSDSILTGGVASVDGKFEWKDGAEVLDSKGIVQKTVVFTPDDTATYNTVEFDVDVTVVICDTASGEHEFTVPQKDNSDHWNKCSNCDVIDIKIKHSGDDDGDCTTEVKCSCGHIITEARTAHSGGTATCTAKAKCEVCDTEYGKLLDHKYEWIIDKEPTATEEGSKHEECTVCKAKRNENTAIPKTETNSPQTGDNSNMALWIALLFISGMGIVVTTVYGKKKRNQA